MLPPYKIPSFTFCLPHLRSSLKQGVVCFNGSHYKQIFGFRSVSNKAFNDCDVESGLTELAVPYEYSNKIELLFTST